MTELLHHSGKTHYVHPWKHFSPSHPATLCLSAITALQVNRTGELRAIKCAVKCGNHFLVLPDVSCAPLFLPGLVALARVYLKKLFQEVFASIHGTKQQPSYYWVT